MRIISLVKTEIVSGIDTFYLPTVTDVAYLATTTYPPILLDLMSC